MHYITRMRFTANEEDKFFARFSSAIACAEERWHGAVFQIDADAGTALVMDKHDRVLCTMRQVELL